MIKKLLPFIIILFVFLGIFYLNSRIDKKALDQEFQGIIESVYVCTKLDLCVILEDSNEEYYLDYYYVQKGDPINVGDSLSKKRGSFKLEHYKINENGKFYLFDILDGERGFK